MITTLIIQTMLMYYINDTKGRNGGEEQRTMKTQQEKEARRRLTEEFAELLRLRPEDGLRWTGSLYDLMEVAHIAYTQGTIRDAEGCVCTFLELARRICTVLHVAMPRNPRCYATRAEQRKGVRRGPFIERYTWQLFRSRIANPLRSALEKEISI